MEKKMETTIKGLGFSEPIGLSLSSLGGVEVFRAWG